MNVLVCGATGFVGRHIAHALHQSGHTVYRGVRKPTRAGDIAMDYRTDTRAETWLPRLAGISVVINAVGVLRDSPTNAMASLHTKAPRALFEACANAGVERIVQVSASGVDRGIQTPYFTTRLQAEQTLLSLSGNARSLILRPSLIYGEDGASARMFRLLARLPLHLLPAGGLSPLQPVHIDDICAAVHHWLEDPAAESQIVPAVGSESTTLRGMLDSYRAQTHLAPALHLSVPRYLMQFAARLGDHIPASPLCSDTLKMLLAGNEGNPAAFATLLGRPPRSFRHFIDEASSVEYA